jgi:hypothetical protein
MMIKNGHHIPPTMASPVTREAGPPRFRRRHVAYWHSASLAALQWHGSYWKMTRRSCQRGVASIFLPWMTRLIGSQGLPLFESH